MQVTDQEIAQALDKRREEIQELKKMNPALYEVLQYGVLCQKLSLSPEDLEKFHQKLEKEEEKG